MVQKGFILSVSTHFPNTTFKIQMFVALINLCAFNSPENLC